MIKKDFSFFKNRSERANFILCKFKSYINKSGSILDVGCSENDLKRLIGDIVFGIDIAGTPDKNVDLEKKSLSGFTNSSYDFIVCTEVLEHVDNFYEVLDDLRRVSRKYILISLPNCPDIWKVLRIIFTGRTGKFYGLPRKKPEDRHKWFFSWKELDEFFIDYCSKNNLKIKERFMHFNYTNSLKGRIIKLFLRILPIKSFAQSYWILIEKKNETTTN